MDRGRERLGKENKINYSSRKWWHDWRDGELDMRRSNKTFTFFFFLYIYSKRKKKLTLLPFCWYTSIMLNSFTWRNLINLEISRICLFLVRIIYSVFVVPFSFLVKHLNQQFQIFFKHPHIKFANMEHKWWEILSCV